MNQWNNLVILLQKPTFDFSIPVTYSRLVVTGRWEPAFLRIPLGGCPWLIIFSVKHPQLHPSDFFCLVPGIVQIYLCLGTYFKLMSSCYWVVNIIRQLNILPRTRDHYLIPWLMFNGFPCVVFRTVTVPSYEVKILTQLCVWVCVVFILVMINFPIYHVPLLVRLLPAGLYVRSLHFTIILARCCFFLVPHGLVPSRFQLSLPVQLRPLIRLHFRPLGLLGFQG